MKHYGIAQWVDFARGLVTAEDAAAMRKHASTCQECREMADYCSSLARVCTGMETSDVPADVIRRALSVFPVKFQERPKRSFRIPAELIYDSFLVPAPAGLRSNWQVGWQALYHAGDCSLDLRIEPELRSSRAAVIGQISNHVAPDDHMVGIPVCVKAGRLVVAETRSNQFGEFQMEYEQQNRLQLCVYLEGGAKSILVPLKKFVPAAPAGAGRLNLGSGVSRRRSGAKRQLQG
jgi:hypothetical protein